MKKQKVYGVWDKKNSRWYIANFLLTKSEATRSMKRLISYGWNSQNMKVLSCHLPTPLPKGKKK